MSLFILNVNKRLKNNILSDVNFILTFVENVEK